MSLKISRHADDVGTLIQMAMDITQRAVTRVYEIVELEKRSLKENERIALQTLIEFFGIASSDSSDLLKKSKT